VGKCQEILATSPDDGGDLAPLFSIEYPLINPEEAERDRRLVSNYLQGDMDAFFVIVDDHSTVLFEDAKQVLGAADAADEAVHETFQRALLAIRGFDRNGQWKLRSWLRAILRQVWIERLNLSSE
jgi:DNA-directed RNA polymerase specialized sigma24 family protein